MKIKLKIYGIEDNNKFNCGKIQTINLNNNKKRLIDLLNFIGMTKEDMSYYKFLINGQPCSIEDTIKNNDKVVIFPVLGGG